MPASDLHVLMTADAVGGVWTYTLDLARGLAWEGVRVTIAVLGPMPNLEQRGHAAAVDGLAVVETGLPLDWTGETPETVLEAGRTVGELADALGVDLVHLNSPALGAALPAGKPVVAVCHSCVLTWWQAVRGGPPPEDFVWRGDLVRRGYERADALIAPSAAFAAATARVYGLRREPTVVHNGRRAFESPADGAASADAPFVFTAGRLWDEAKSLSVLDRAAALVGMPVLAAGSLHGPNGAAVAFDHVRPLGYLTEADLAAQLARRPIYASPAVYEPFGLAVLEAAQAGCPLVLAETASFRELWDGAAVFTPPGDHEALAEALGSLARDAEFRDELGRHAQARAELYGLEPMTRGILAVYRALLPAPRAEAA